MVRGWIVSRVVNRRMCRDNAGVDSNGGIAEMDSDAGIPIHQERIDAGLMWIMMDSMYIKSTSC